MRATAQRLLRLIALLQARRHWSGAELAERMGVDRRSIRRDIERLRELGYPVQASSGVGGGYRLGAGAPALPLLLEEDEATLLAIALRAAAGSVAGIDEAAAAVLAKLDPLVPAPRRRQAGQVHAATATLAEPASVDLRLLGRLARACQQAEQLQLDYRSHDGGQSQRRLDPQQLLNYGRRWYLLAWDLERADWRTLRVDRMGALQATGEPGLRRPLPAPAEAMLRRAVGQAPFALQAQLRLAGTVEQLQAELPPWSGALEEDGPGHCQLRMGADSVALLAGQIVSLGRLPLQVVCTPPGLRPVLAEHVARLAQALAVV